MRVIKFRIWDIINKEYNYFPDRQFLIGLGGDLYDGNGCLYDEKHIIQQFTGFKDKNGKEIYEGDIFRGGKYKWDAVTFADGKFVVNLKGTKVFDLCELFEAGDIPEIVGNIYEG